MQTTRDRDFEMIALTHLYMSGGITLTEFIGYVQWNLKTSEERQLAAEAVSEVIQAMQMETQRVLATVKSLP